MRFIIIFKPYIKGTCTIRGSYVNDAMPQLNSFHYNPLFAIIAEEKEEDTLTDILQQAQRDLSDRAPWNRADYIDWDKSFQIFRIDDPALEMEVKFISEVKAHVTQKVIR